MGMIPVGLTARTEAWPRRMASRWQVSATPGVR